METIYIDYGLYTQFTVDLSEVNFDGVDKIVLTAKKYVGTTQITILQKEYTSSSEYVEVVTPEESKSFDGVVHYDFIAFMTSGEVYRASDVGKMVLRKGVGRVE